MHKLSSKIKFTASSIAWSYGGIIYFDIKASEGSTILVDWGNGRTTQHEFLCESEKRCECDYFPKRIIPPSDGIKYHVEISSNDDCRIIGFVLNPIDMNAIDLDVTNCPELEELTYFGCHMNIKPLRSPDLSRNTALKYLNCGSNGFTSLNLANNTALEKLCCRDNRLSHLSLLSNFALKKLDCEFNKMEQLFISYAPQLSEVAFEVGNNIDKATKIRIQEFIAENI